MATKTPKKTPAVKSKKDNANKLVLDTKSFQEMVGRAVKGAGNNKILPLTQMMDIKLENNMLVLTTTDMTNYLYIRKDKVDGADFDVVVPVEMFSKLISKLTSENVTLEKKESSLSVKGNGNYEIPLQMDEDGTMVTYPNPLADFEAEGEAEIIQSTTIGTILTSIKPAIAVTMEDPQYTGYYVGDRVIGTNRYLVHALDTKLFDTPKLVSTEVMDLLSVMTTEDISVDFNEDTMVFTSPDCVVYGKEMEGIDDFDVEGIGGYLDTELGSSCTVSRDVLTQLLDRLLLFVSDYDDGAINLTFTEEGIQVSSLTSSGVEVVPYVESKDFGAFKAKVDINELAKQVKSHSSDTIEIQYNGDIDALKLVDGNIIQIIALLDDGEEK